ncbi:hypothetical protein EPIR_0380 [Erwinia piriflorinigrans CFBP 5888]|uniref:Uncharacterized protein n=1 Tax=Erwinia piriflorinigrans CFBP 5888 TaxID=1161919 RepID=V5Z370_9GAMM|nr:hypothetical protein EPIR_0380 [Erwinia piriflorinigrans CFBP 5888]
MLFAPLPLNESFFMRGLKVNINTAKLNFNSIEITWSAL